MAYRARTLLLLAGSCLLLAACGTAPVSPPSARRIDSQPSPQGQEVVMYALGLMETEYRFGGKNPDAGLDCSGMVSYVYRQAAGLKLTGSAADIARKGRRIDNDQLRPGDLVFFNTLRRSHSHVGIYVGNGRFVHAPSSSSGKVRTDSLWSGWFASRFEEARTYLE